MVNQSRYEQITDSCLLEIKPKEDNQVFENTTYYLVKSQFETQLFTKITKLNDSDSKNNYERLGLHISNVQTSKVGYGVELRNTFFSFGQTDKLTTDKELGVLPSNKYFIHEVNSSVPNSLFRFHFRTGYIVPKEGFTMKLFTKVGETTITFANILLTSSNFQKFVQFNSDPFQVGSVVYDRYIDLYIPDPIELSNDSSEMGRLLSIDKAPILYIEASSVNEFTNLDNSKVFEYTLSKEISLRTIVSDSPFEQFGVYLREDKKNNYIEYYPTWGYYLGDKTSVPSILGTNVISNLEDGTIPVYYLSGLQSDEYQDLGLEYKMNYPNAKFRWTTVHELIVTEVYEDARGENVLRTRKQEFIQEYKPTLSVNDLKYKYRPVLGEGGINLKLKSLIVRYNCRLWNKQDNTQIVRSASMTVKDPLMKYGNESKFLKTDILNKYVIYNKQADKIENKITNKGEVNKVYEKIYFDSTDIRLTIDDATNINNKDAISGALNLYIKAPVFNMYQTSHFYKFRLIRATESNVVNGVNSNKNNNIGAERIDLSGAYRYVLRFSTTTGRPIDIDVTYSENMNPVIGELEFYIDEETSKNIRSKSGEGLRYSIMSITATKIESTLASGVVNFI